MKSVALAMHADVPQQHGIFPNVNISMVSTFTPELTTY